MSIKVGDDQAGTPLPGTLYNVKTRTVSGEDYQEISKGLCPYPHDYISVSGYGTNTLTYTFKIGGSVGTTVCIIECVYDAVQNDSSGNLTSASRTYGA